MLGCATTRAGTRPEPSPNPASTFQNTPDRILDLSPKARLFLRSFSSGAHDNDYDRITRTSGELGGKVSEGIYGIAEDVDGHHHRAVAAGARVLMPLIGQNYGGRGDSCLDPEGQVWSFGSYDPMAD